MKIQELPARAYLAHLRRHPVPELMDEECLAALANVEAQFGDTITHGAGLEVRLGNPARFVDYIMCVDQDYVPGIQCIWYEIDYADYLRGGEISPCLFINTSDYKEEKADEPEHTAALLFLPWERSSGIRCCLPLPEKNERPGSGDSLTGCSLHCPRMRRLSKSVPCRPVVSWIFSGWW